MSGRVHVAGAASESAAAEGVAGGAAVQRGLLIKAHRAQLRIVPNSEVVKCGRSCAVGQYVGWRAARYVYARGAVARDHRAHLALRVARLRLGRRVTLRSGDLGVLLGDLRVVSRGACLRLRLPNRAYRRYRG